MGAADDEGDLRAVLRGAVGRVLSSPTADYGAKVAALRRLRGAFHDELAAMFAPAFNAHLSSAAQDDLEEKRTLCAATNETLQTLGLAIRCPKTGKPSILIADSPSPDDDEGRFRLEHRDPDGRNARTWSSPELVQFELQERPVRQEPLSRRLRRRGPDEPSR